MSRPTTRNKNKRHRPEDEIDVRSEVYRRIRTRGNVVKDDVDQLYNVQKTVLRSKAVSFPLRPAKVELLRLHFEDAKHTLILLWFGRDGARVEVYDFKKKEEEFHFAQSKFRSRIRFWEGRTKPIDVLTTYLEDLDEFIELDEPYVVKGLTVSEMESLRQDIKTHLDLDRETPTHLEYWQAKMALQYIRRVI